MTKFIPPRRRTNAELRNREYLTESEVEDLQRAARKQGRHGHRDGSLILLAFSHGFRVTELVNLRWSQIDLKSGNVHVSRLKNGNSSVHPLRGKELRALRRLAREYPSSPFVFNSERGGPLTASSVRKIVARAGEAAKFDFPTHPHMLRHATGYYLANNGQDTRAIQSYLGHKSINHTVRYTELAPGRFQDFWKD